MCRGFDPLARLKCAHVSANPFIEFRPPITLAYQAVGILTTEMTANSCLVDLIEDTLLQFFMMRNNNTRGIRSIRAIAQQAAVDRISM